MGKYHAGQHVRLPANEEEGWADETGIISDEEEPEFPGMYIVFLDDDFLSGPDDDGMREVHEDDIEPI